jgi:hypothetical protein
MRKEPTADTTEETVREWMSCVAVLVALASAVSADPALRDNPGADAGPNPELLRTFVTTEHNPSSGMIGLHLDRPASLRQPHGISLDLDNQPVWDTCAIDFEWPDLILAYSHTLKADNLRIRSDTAQVELGQRVGHPITPFQLHIGAGNEQAPLGGIGIGTYGYQHGLYLYNRQQGLKRTNISLYNLFALGTDTQMNGTGDFQFYNYQARAPVWTVQPNNDFRLTAPRIGFFSAAPAAQPTVTGSWSDGTAQRSLLAALVRLGLVKDATTR